VLYKMLAGHDPFQHCTNVYDLVVAHLSEAPRPPSETAPNFIPAALDAAVLKALAKHPADRHADARAFRAAIATPFHAAPVRRWQSTERLDHPVSMPHAAIPAHVPKPAASTFAYDLDDGQTVAIVRKAPSRGGSRYAAAAIGAVLGMGAAAFFMRTEIASLASPAHPSPSESVAPPLAAPAPASAVAMESASANPRPSATPAASSPRAPYQQGARGAAPPAASVPTAPNRLFGTDP
jgi:serine/threonine-protein kinase